MASLTITSISVTRPLCPLVDTGKQGRTVYFSNDQFVLWSAADQPDVPRPAVCPGTSISLDVTLSIKGGDNLASGAGISLGATRDHNKFPGDAAKSVPAFVEEKKAQWDPKNPVVRCSIIPPKMSDGSQKRMPWAFYENIEWTIVAASKEVKLTTKLELYVLPSYIPTFMLRDGIPLGLLRLDTLVPSWMKLSDPTRNDWPVFAVDAIFTDRRLCYDTFRGDATYSSPGPRQSDNSQISKASCWIDLWLSDMNGLSGESATKPVTAGNGDLQSYPVNCLDTAALVQTIASLNVQDPDAKSYMIYMGVFGFIKDTLLIGRHQGNVPDAAADLCNNPFYKNSEYKPIMRINNKLASTRSSFGTHVFLTIDRGNESGLKVFDACCGPHKGTNTLPQYLKAAIDDDNRLYSPNKWEGFGKNHDEIRPQGPGLLSDAMFGKGVVSLATPASFVRGQSGPTTNSSSPSLFQRMAEALDDGQNTLLPPFEGSPAGVSGIVATWTFKYKPGQWTSGKESGASGDETVGVVDEVTESQISIWRFDNKDEALWAYQRRRAALQGFEERGTDNDLWFRKKPGYYMFRWSIDPEDHFMVVVDGDMEDWTVKKLVDTLKRAVLDQPLPQQTSIESLSPLKTPQKLNSTFVLELVVGVLFLLPIIHALLSTNAKSLKPSKQTESWWRGYKVETAAGVSPFKVPTGVLTKPLTALAESPFRELQGRPERRSGLDLLLSLAGS